MYWAHRCSNGDLGNNMIDSVVYKQWVSVDRCTLETVTKPTDEFME